MLKQMTQVVGDVDLMRGCGGPTSWPEHTLVVHAAKRNSQASAGHRNTPTASIASGEKIRSKLFQGGTCSASSFDEST